LESGADDFIRKPVSPAELVARVRALERLKGLSDQIQSQVTMLEESQQLREEWVHMIVHDLRSPLAATQGYTELVSNQVEGKNQKRLERVLTEADRLSSMLGEMLIMAKSTSGRLELRKGL
jgi:signal transduction histidine kinase